MTNEERHEHYMTRVAIFAAGGMASGTIYGMVGCIFMAIAWLICARYSHAALGHQVSVTDQSKEPNRS
jgi:hypothetical protein